jgi:hypothetical protein
VRRKRRKRREGEGKRRGDTCSDKTVGAVMSDGPQVTSQLNKPLEDLQVAPSGREDHRIASWKKNEREKKFLWRFLEIKKSQRNKSPR